MESKIQLRHASPPPSAWAPPFDGECWLPEPSQQLYWFGETDDCSDDTAATTSWRQKPSARRMGWAKDMAGCWSRLQPPRIGILGKR